MKFPKTIRFDNSDLNIFENPSEEGEWAISGAFSGLFILTPKPVIFSFIR